MCVNARAIFVLSSDRELIGVCVCVFLSQGVAHAPKRRPPTRTSTGRAQHLARHHKKQGACHSRIPVCGLPI